MIEQKLIKFLHQFMGYSVLVGRHHLTLPQETTGFCYGKQLKKDWYDKTYDSSQHMAEIIVTKLCSAIHLFGVSA